MQFNLGCFNFIFISVQSICIYQFDIRHYCNVSFFSSNASDLYLFTIYMGSNYPFSFCSMLRKKVSFENPLHKSCCFVEETPKMMLHFTLQSSPLHTYVHLASVIHIPHNLQILTLPSTSINQLNPVTLYLWCHSSPVKDNHYEQIP